MSKIAPKKTFSALPYSTAENGTNKVPHKM